jgi:hypothetical protein
MQLRTDAQRAGGKPPFPTCKCDQRSSLIVQFDVITFAGWEGRLAPALSTFALLNAKLIRKFRRGIRKEVFNRDEGDERDFQRKIYPLYPLHPCKTFCSFTRENLSDILNFQAHSA